MDFQLVTDMQPRGDQPQAIEQLTERVLKGEKHSVLLGVTGSGKTFTMAHVIANVKKPTLIISHNKTLAAQLYSEFKAFFPNNAVHYFVSYYDYYIPEAYIPQRDLYIEKDCAINEYLDRLRLATTNALLSRRDVIVIASVSCIYNIGAPSDYESMSSVITVGDALTREALIETLVSKQFERNEFEFRRGIFRVRGDTIELYPTYEDTAIRIEIWGDIVRAITRCHPLTGNVLESLQKVRIFPSKHFVTPQDRMEAGLKAIEADLEKEVDAFRKEGKLVESQRLESRTLFDLEMMREVGYCKGIENYSRYFDGRKPGESPYTLMNYFPKDFLCIIDESHQTIPQIHGMYNGDHARKRNLVEFGFRMKSAYDNRPLRFDEFVTRLNQVIYVSATPAPYELRLSKGKVVEQIIRPTGLVDPHVTVHKTNDQVEDLIKRVQDRASKGERVLVTTLTKRLAEELASYLEGIKDKDGRRIRSKYLHSEIETIDRVKILKDLREGRFDVLVGVNLLREGLDLPEVSLVCIFDADKQGFLRSATSLIQTMGRTARNIGGEVVLYADKVTDAMRVAMQETERRRKIQMEYNAKNGITPQTVKKEIRAGIEELLEAHKLSYEVAGLKVDEGRKLDILQQLEEELERAVQNMEFERAAEIRDSINEIAGNEYLKTVSKKISVKVKSGYSGGKK